MEIEVFDDKHSFSHFILGIATFKKPYLFVIFFFYELVEFCYKYGRKEERPEHFIGDCFEYFAGISAIFLLSQFGFTLEKVIQIFTKLLGGLIG
ncbi:hypothetical protein DRN38_06675 [Thermococci archaeon]|nr:MAG: hypothetical protein DRN38_06675 [Thermococci archaeon]